MRALKQEADERLLVEAAKKDPACFADLYESNFDRVYAYIARRVSGRQEAEDVTSEVFHQALAKLSSFEWRGAPFAAWLFRIAHNTLADRWARAKREAGNPLEEEPADLSMQDAERRAMLFQLVATLPDDQRAVVMKRFVEQKSIREIARELRRTEGAVKQLQFRAISRLRAEMEGARG